MPTSRFDGGGWIDPARLPLGAGWKGYCSAPGHEGAEPSADELRDWCNLGYATGCLRRPKHHSCDAVRFSVARDGAAQLTILYACESAHRPTGHGTLDYDVASRRWISSHPDARIQKMAECYVQSYLAHRIGPEAIS
jgi:hypothetical protein